MKQISRHRIRRIKESYYTSVRPYQAIILALPLSNMGFWDEKSKTKIPTSTLFITRL